MLSLVLIRAQTPVSLMMPTKVSDVGMMDGVKLTVDSSNLHNPRPYSLHLLKSGLIVTEDAAWSKSNCEVYLPSWSWSFEPSCA